MGFFDDDDGAASSEPELPRPFASALGTADFALLERLACTPLGQIQGASLHQLSWPLLPPRASWDGELYAPLDAVTQGWAAAREAAFARLHDRAVALDADAVVGARLTRGEHVWGRDTIDYVVSGTAIRSPGRSRTLWGPVVCDLTMPAYLQLLDAGWEAAGLVAATTVIFVSQSTGRRWRTALSVTGKDELPEYSRGFAVARAQTLAEVRAQAAGHGADGIVGLRLEHRVEAKRLALARALPPSPARRAAGGDPAPEHREGVAVTIHAAGTAIRRRAHPEREAPGLRLTL